MTAAPSKINSQSEPTITDAMESIADLREIVTVLTQAVVEGFERSDRKFEKLESIFSVFQIGQENLLVEVHDIKRRVVHLEYQMADVQEVLYDLSEAETKDAIASINHEERIIRLEKIHNIQAVSPQHLADIE